MSNTFYNTQEFKDRATSLLQKLIKNNIVSPGLATSSSDHASMIITALLENPKGESFKEFSELFGFPIWFCKVYQLIYESLPEDFANRWAEELFQSIPIGCNLETLKPSLYQTLLSDEELGIKAKCTGNVDAIYIIDFLQKNVEACCKFYNKDLALHWQAELTMQIEKIRKAKSTSKSIAGALFCVEDILSDDILGAIENSISSKICLTKRKEILHKIKNGSFGLVGAFRTSIGPLGCARKSDREDEYKKFGIFLLQEIKKLLPGNQPPLSPEIRYFIENGLRKRPLEVKPHFHPLPQGSEAVEPKKHVIILLHILMRIGGISLSFTGLVTAITSTILLIELPSAPFLLNQWAISRGLLVVFILLGRLLLHYGRHLSAGHGWYNLLFRPQNTVIYLHSFEDDKIINKRTYRNPFWAIFFPRLTMEEEAIKSLNVLGNVVAIGRPGEKLPSKGASRIYVNDNVWEKTIVKLMKKSRLSVFAVGYGNALKSEISWARQILQPEQVVLYIPDHRWQEFVRYYGEETTISFATFLEELLYYKIGTDINTNQLKACHFLWFKPSWNVKPLHSLDRIVSSVFGSLTKMHRVELQPVFNWFGAKTKRVDLKTVICWIMVLLCSAIASYYVSKLFH